MDLLKELESIKADHSSAVEAKAELASQLAKAVEAQAISGAALEQARQDCAEREVGFEQVKAELAQKSGELASALAQIAELTASQKTAEQLAIEIVARQGIKPLKQGGNPEAKSKAEALAEYDALIKAGKPFEAGTYFKQNKSIILG